MKTIELKDSDMNKAKALNVKNGYGLDTTQMMKLISKHESGDDYQRTLIVYRLTDINFHREVALLQSGKYDELRKEVEKW